jgi:hypothetical protein
MFMTRVECRGLARWHRTWGAEVVNRVDRVCRLRRGRKAKAIPAEMVTRLLLRFAGDQHDRERERRLRTPTVQLPGSGRREVLRCLL